MNTPVICNFMGNIMYIVLLILLISCQRNGEGKIVASATDSSRPNKKQINYGVIYKDESVVLYGDRSIDSSKISYASIKFEPYISFDDYPVADVIHRKVTNIDFKSNKGAKMFRTALKEEFASDTANFAGHYTFVYWGCGSPCQSSLIIDRLTGKVYDSPSSSLGYKFHNKSRMLIVNPPDSTGYYDNCFYCKPIIYIFNEQSKKFVELLPKKN